MRYHCRFAAGVAQLVEQLIRNEKVEGSIPFTGTNEIKSLARQSAGFVFSGPRRGHAAAYPPCSQ